MSRYNVELSGETDNALNRLAKHAASKADAIRKAISIAAWMDEAQRSGKRILVEEENGRVREVLWK